jgi:type I restriction enzyme S subunit
MEDRLNELPRGWVRTTLGEVSEVILGQSPPSSTYNEVGKGLPFYQGKLEFGDIYPSPQKWCSSPKKIAEKNDVLISVRAPVGPTNICPEKSCIGRGLAAIRPMGGMESFFVLYLIRAFERNVAEQGTGTTFNAITGGKLSGFGIHLPPLPEQHRIVAKIEELFTRLDAGVEALKKIKAQLKRYRQAVLKCAFEGKLTQEWREANKDKLEPASVLLEKIKEERKNVRANLRVCPDKNNPEKGEHIGSPLQKDLPPLPEGWVWTRLGVTSEIIMGQSPPSSTYNETGNGLPFYQGKLEFGDFYPTPRKWCSSPQKIAEKGDVLISIRAPVGPTNICPGKSCIGRGLASIRTLGGIKTFFMLYLMRAFEQKIANQGTGTTFNAITVDQLKNIEIPLPSLPEQQKIVEEIESRLSIADNVEKVVDQSLKQSERLRRSILKRAFEGKLVPQDPTDEPAEKLLERIRGEKIKL